MSRHEGVSCDSCLKGNFRGKRYKCLICYDYDLCSACYEAGATTTRHTTEHPMQCIITRSEYELYYGGETFNSVETPQAYTCPYCNRMGFTDVTLQEHVSSEHSDVSYEVVCPVCASIPGGDPNLMTDDLAGHLTLEHRSGPRDLISFLDEPVSSRAHNVRRIPHNSRGASSSRSRRSNMHFSSSGGLTSLSPSSRDNVDPIAELLSQLSGVRRSATNTAVSLSSSSQRSHLLQLQRQLQLEHCQVARQQLERLPRRQLQTSVTGGSTQTQATVVREPTTQGASVTTGTVTGNGLLLSSMQQQSTSPTRTTQFLLAGLLEAKNNDPIMEERRAERSLFVQQLLYSTVCENDEGMEKLPSLFPPAVHMKKLIDSRPKPPIKEKIDFNGLLSRLTISQEN